MKSHVITAFLCILVLTSCLPTATTTDDGKRSTVTQTDTLVPEKPFTPTATDVKTLVIQTETSVIPTATDTPVPEKPFTPTATDVKTLAIQTETPAIPTATNTGILELTKDFMVIQQGTDAPAFRLQDLPSQELVDNHIGLWWENYDRYQDSNLIYSNGFTRMRIGSLLDWSGDDQGWPLNEDTLLPRVDDKITEYAENGTSIVLPNHMGSEVSGIHEEFTQEDIDIILEFTAFLVERFQGRIAYYEIWNEFGNHYKVDTYVNLVEQSTALIKEIDPNAKVIIGSIPGDTVYGEEGYGEFPRHIFHTTYLWALIDAIDFHQVEIDGFSWHPFYDIIPEDDYYQDYPQLVREIRARASAKGFTGEYFADEILWAANDDFPGNPPFSRIIAQKYYLRTITEHRALDVNVTINTFFQEPVVDAIRSLNNVLAGAESADGIEFALETSQDVQYLRQYAFAMPNGDILLALWQNGPAADEDIGIVSTLTIADVSASSITGINVFYGFEQELVAETEGNSLVIHDLLVKDYPIFIKIARDSP